MKIGLFLGTFNPPTIAHVSLIASVLNENLVDVAYMVPTVQNPWKQEPPEATFEERCSMITRSLVSVNKTYLNKCACLDVEKKLFPPYYSCNTLEKIKQMFPDDELFIIGGADVINSVHEWLRFDEVIKPNFKFICFTRSGSEAKNDNITFTLVESELPDTSSTQVRELIKKDKCAFPFIASEIVDDCQKIYKADEYFV